MCTSTLIKIGY